MRAAIGLASLTAIVIAAPFASACYVERVQACRDPMTDFRSLTNAQLVSPRILGSTAEQAAPFLGYEVSASTTLRAGETCVAIHSELWSGGSRIEVIDTPIRASIAGGTLTTTTMLHYRAGPFPVMLRVTALGQTLEATLTDPSAIAHDAGAADARD